MKNVYNLLVQSSDDEAERLTHYKGVLLDSAEIIPLSAEILMVAVDCETRLNLQPQDAVVYASALGHLQQRQGGQTSCFLNKNARDFDKPEIKAELARHGCSLIYRFDQGLGYIRSAL